jgi:preprotein translocase subunit YajC
MAVVVVGFIYYTSRSNKKAQAERQNKLSLTQPGDKVVTIGGLHGVIHSLDNENAIVTIDCDGVLLDFDLAALKTVDHVAEAVEVVSVNESPIAE